MLDREQVRNEVISAHMRTMVQSLEWKVFQEEIDQLEDRLVEALITETHRVENLQGEIRGVRRVRDLPNFLISRGKGN